MIRKQLLLVFAILAGYMTVVHARINYVPLYIIDTKPDVTEVKRSPALPLFITQDGHSLTLPEFEDSVMFKVFKAGQCVYETTYSPTVEVPVGLVGDYEVRLCADTYYYYGFITLEVKLDIPTETQNWENITLLGSNTPLEVILDNLMKLNVVEYDLKYPNEMIQRLDYLSGEEKEAYLQEWKEWKERHSGRVGLLIDELKVLFPQLVDTNSESGMNTLAFFPILISCIQELKTQLDSRTEALVDIMTRSASPTAFNAARAAIGNTLLSVAPTRVNESALVRFLLTDDARNAYIVITDMGGRSMKKVPVLPSDTSATIDSGILGEGIFLCTLLVNGEDVSTKRLVKTK